jgi:signal peptidase I
VLDEALQDLAEYFNFRQAPDGPWSRDGDGWRLDARAVKPGSDAGMMLFQKDLWDDYIDPCGRRVVGRRAANDARLECEVRLAEPAGALRFRLVEAGDTFEARLEPLPGGGVRAQLLRFNSASLQDPENLRRRIEALAQAEMPFAPGDWHRIAFENVDNHLILDVDARRLTADYEANEQHAGLKPAGQTSLGARVAFGGEGCDASFRGVRVLRDLCYASVGEHGVGEPLQLGPGEYFVLGDNSSDSRDSRMFGAVRAEQIVGRPVLVVWPWSRRRILGGVEPR